jgi:hypothetical protein
VNRPIHYGIPTLYRGITFRSRVEACFACFFDNASWQWEYEPADLAGYIPDFVLRFYRPLLIEVKADYSLDLLAQHCGKIERSGWEHEALITLGAPDAQQGGAPIIGLLGERNDMPREFAWQWSPARMFTCLSCGSLSVLAEDGDWRCRVCGAGDGNSHVGTVDGELKEWALAKNRVQWRSGT